MHVVSADAVANLRADLHRSLPRPSLVRRVWYWLLFGRMPMEQPVMLPWRDRGYRVGMPETRVWRDR